LNETEKGALILFYASHEANLKIKHYVMQRPVDFFSNLLTIHLRVLTTRAINAHINGHRTSS
jgi:hypothetical protein